jgi:hypothetical protein
MYIVNLYPSKFASNKIHRISQGTLRVSIAGIESRCVLEINSIYRSWKT